MTPAEAKRILQQWYISCLLRDVICGDLTHLVMRYLLPSEEYSPDTTKWHRGTDSVPWECFATFLGDLLHRFAQKENQNAMKKRNDYRIFTDTVRVAWKTMSTELSSVSNMLRGHRDSNDLILEARRRNVPHTALTVYRGITTEFCGRILPYRFLNTHREYPGQFKLNDTFVNDFCSPIEQKGFRRSTPEEQDYLFHEQAAFMSNAVKQGNYLHGLLGDSKWREALDNKSRFIRTFGDTKLFDTRELERIREELTSAVKSENRMCSLLIKTYEKEATRRIKARKLQLNRTTSKKLMSVVFPEEVDPLPLKTIGNISPRLKALNGTFKWALGEILKNPCICHEKTIAVLNKACCGDSM